MVVKGTMLLVIIFLCCSSLNKVDKKSKMLDIVKEYSPANYELLIEYPESTINVLAKGTCVEEYIFDLPLIIHEADHFFSSKINSVQGEKIYRLNDTLNFKIKKFYSFPCRKVNKIIDSIESNKIYRYNIYINSIDTNQITQIEGFFGLMEEYNAYFHEFQIYNSLYLYLKAECKFEKPEIWMKYLCDIGSVRYSLDEFELFVLWYLRTAKTEYPEVYNKIVSDKDIQFLLQFISKENEKMKNEYQQNRDFILKNLTGKLDLRGDFLYLGATNKGIHDEQTNLIKQMLYNEKKR